MKFIRYFSLLLLCMLMAAPLSAKKYKWTYGQRQSEVYTTGQGKNRTQLVKVWSIGKNVDKAILTAKMDAVEAALFQGIPFDASTHGMGVSNLSPLVSQQQYLDNETLFSEFFKTGEFLTYIREVNSTYPSGENNVQVPGGRRVGVNLVIDYPGLREWLQNNGVIKGLNQYFKN